MLNQVIIVGRMVKDPEVKTTSDGKKVSHIVLAVNRNFKNTETGRYDTDFIYTTLWENLAVATANHCQKGSIVGLKGRITNKTVELESSKKLSVLELITENITFISSGKDHSNGNAESNNF